jgi:hypothetical protein
MARFLSLISHAVFCLGVAGWIGCFSTRVRAETPMAPTPAPPAAPVKPASPGTASAKTTATTNAPAAMAPDALNRYGSIIVPSDEAMHPLRLRLPFPGVGEVKVPNQGELTMREKLEQLATLSDDDIHMQLSKWPAYSKMNLRDQASMLARIQDFRDYRSKIAQQKAHDMGLLTLTDEQKKKFEKDYWDNRLKMDRDLARQFEPIYKDREQKFKDELYREYSSTSGVPVAQGPQPPTPVAPAKQPAASPSTASNTPPSSPLAPMKSAPSVGTTSEPMTQH